MTISLVAVETDVVRDGKPVIGYGFTSNGRYAQGGILRERFIPRIMAADPRSSARRCGRQPRSRRPSGQALMSNEKPGGHGDRAIAAGALDMAVWDAVAKIAGNRFGASCRERYNGGNFDEQVLVYPGGGYYYPGKEIEGLQAEMRGYQEQGYRVVKMKIGGADLRHRHAAHRGRARGRRRGENLAVDANGRFDLDTRAGLRQGDGALRSVLVRGAGRPARLPGSTPCSARRLIMGPLATGENLFSVQDVRNLLRYGGMRPDRDWIQLDPALCYGLTHISHSSTWSRRTAGRGGACIPHGGHQLASTSRPACRLGGSESYPGVFQPYGGFADDIARSSTATCACRTSPASAWS